MKIPKVILKSWKLKREHGDIEKIHDLSKKINKKVSTKTIGTALNTGRCEKETFDVIAKYYKEGDGQEEKLIQEALEHE
jgi:hypothetical protein